MDVTSNEEGKSSLQLHVCGNYSSEEALRKEATKFYFHEVTPGELEEAVKLVHHFCLHCDNSPHIKRRRYTAIIHAETSNKVLHTDYLYIVNGYVLVLTDDLSRKVLLHYTKNANAINVIKAIVKWKSACGLPDKFVLYSDQGAHFANTLVKGLVRELRGKHKMSTAYAPWTNSGAERTNRVILSEMRSLCSELLYDMENWPDLLPMVECFMNNRKRESLGFTPNEIFWGKRNIDALMPDENQEPFSIEETHVVISRGKEWDVKQASETARRYMERIADNMEIDHGKIFQQLDRKRQKARDSLNKRFNVQDIQYEIGDWVLLSTKGTKVHREKLRLRWAGPYRITGIKGNHLYELEDINKKKKEAHAQRIKFYCGKWMETDELVKSAWLYNEGSFEVDEFIGVKASQEGYLLLIRWKGFESFDPTWEKLSEMVRVVPERIESFLKSSYGGRRVKEEIKRILSGSAKAAQRIPLYHYVILKYPVGIAALSEPVRPGLSRSRGWIDTEREVLDALIRYKGFGKWNKMLKVGALPGKTKSQVINEVQQLIRSQRLA
eukprot:maker-scaffold_70-snap-gene-0.112-mRNA-1 protein AED:0.48 eAED:0.52 QI:0/0/0/1/0/0/2/0/552